MVVIKRSTLITFWTRHPETEPSLRTWFARTKSADWASGADVIRDFPKAKTLGGDRARVEIAGGSYRLIVAIDYRVRTFYVKWIGTHAAYDRIDAQTVEWTP